MKLCNDLKKKQKTGDAEADGASTRERAATLLAPPMKWQYALTYYVHLYELLMTFIFS